MVDIAKVLFADAANRELTWFFPQRMNNSVMLWAALNGSIGIIIFLLSFYFFGKHHGVNIKSWGLKISKIELTDLPDCISIVEDAFLDLLLSSVDLFVFT